MKLKLCVTYSGKLLVVALLFLNLYGFAQQAPAVSVIKGRVTDAETNDGLGGATVGVKGTATMTQTDKNGNYSIAADAASTLTFSYVGSKSTEIKVASQTVINVTLHQSGEQLKDVVVTTALGLKERNVPWVIQ